MLPSSDCECPKILIVDDNEFNLYSLKLLLESLDYDCDSETNGQKAVNAVMKKETQNPCGCHYMFILLDCMMPVMDGWTACSILR